MDSTFPSHQQTDIASSVAEARLATKRVSDLAVLALLGTGIALLHILANGQYGFHRDELDIIMNARQLDWGYVAYPPVTPAIARFGLALFGESLRGLRLFSAVGQGVVVVLVGLMARDFGGRRPAQILAALAVAISAAALTAGTLIQYMSFDYLFWVLLAFFVVRVLVSEDPRWWLGVGAAVGLGMMTKYTIIFFVAGLAAAVLLTRDAARAALPLAVGWRRAGAADLPAQSGMADAARLHFAGLPERNPRPRYRPGSHRGFSDRPALHLSQPVHAAAVDRRPVLLPVSASGPTVPRWDGCSS